MAFFAEPYVSIFPNKMFVLPDYEPMASLSMEIDYYNNWNQQTAFSTYLDLNYINIDANI